MDRSSEGGGRQRKVNIKLLGEKKKTQRNKKKT